MISEKDRAALRFSDQAEHQVCFRHGWDARDLEVEELKKNIEDFEKLAVEWRDGYNKEERKLKKRIMELEQIVEEIQGELKEERNEQFSGCFFGCVVNWNRWADSVYDCSNT